MLPNTRNDNEHHWQKLHDAVAGDKSAQAIIGALKLLDEDVQVVNEAIGKLIEKIDRLPVGP